MKKILVVEDDKDVAFGMKACLEGLDFEVTVAHDGYAALLAVDQEDFSIAILDVVLPKLDGLHLCRILRSRERYIPIIVVSALSDISDRLRGFEVGADDYITKPVDCDELMAKIKALFRLLDHASPSGHGSSSSRIQLGNLLIDPAKHQVLREGREVDLTALEFSLLSCMARSPGKVFSRSQLLREVWGYNNDCYMHTVESHINRLRRKIEMNPSRPTLLLTVRGVGYKLTDP